MNNITKLYLQKKFQEFYMKHYIGCIGIQNREFGIGNLEKKIAFRHRSFKSTNDLNKYLRLNAPFYISYSSAYYEFPEAEMNKKGWMGADLIFDFDVENFLEKENFEKVKEECLKLLDFLKQDFGFKNIRVNFSGSKGFHVKVFDEKVRKIDKDGRMEILNYITGNGLDIKKFFEKRKEGDMEFLVGPGKDARGWGRRINALAQQILKERISNKRIRKEKREKAKKILEEIELGKWENFERELNMDDLKKDIKKEAVNLTSDVDKQVTQDIVRLIRLENTLHGGTGFIAKIIDIEKFNLSNFSDVIAFGEDKEEIFLKEDVKFCLLKNYDLKKGICKVPEYVGIYLLLKDKAEVVAKGGSA